MGIKLEKKCNPAELKVGYRYSISQNPTEGHACLVLSSKECGRPGEFYLELRFYDGVEAGIYSGSKSFTFYEFPFSPLEQELL